MQESPQSHSLRFHGLVHATTENIFPLIDIGKNVITIRYRIIISPPNSVDTLLNFSCLIIIIKHIRVIISYIRVHLAYHIQKAHRLISTIHLLSCHNRVYSCQRIPEASFRLEQNFLFYLRLRIHIQPIIATTQQKSTY